LRTPHAIIRTMVEVAQADPLGRDVDVLLHRIGTTNDRAIATTEGLLALARAGRGDALETESVDLAALAAAAIADARTDAEGRSIRIASSLAPVVVTGNRALLAQLVVNLMQNAVTHNVDGGWVSVITGSSALTVANGGAALSADIVPTLTEPFVRGAGRSRASGNREGAGLGLAIVASIVRAHGGTLDVAGPPDGGLQVRVTLPR
ncbi:MAG: baeS 2, partial [Labilithrix sp.]|nr:baeS 2 [Labilithrix sp.]